jgi:hypothetical protein
LLSHLRSCERYDEPETLPYSINPLCPISADGGHYTQGREFLLRLHCPVIINGIPTNIAEQPDLIDRIITFRCDYLGDKVRSDDTFWRKFDLAKPMLFGRLLDGLVGAMKVRQQFNGDNDEAAERLLGGWRPRFVDAVVWAESVCQAMGFEPGEYVEAHKDNKDVAFREIAENEPICIGIRKLIARHGAWQGYPAQLCAAISPYVIAAPNGVWLARTLPWFIPVLDKVYGINIVMNKRLQQDDNRNGIVIGVNRNIEEGAGVSRGRYFRDSPEASGKKTPTSSPTVNAETGPLANSPARSGFRRRF